jgi:hypothetical protein
MADSLYWSTSLALNFEGADGANSPASFVDVSPTPKTPTVTGAAQLDTGITPATGTGALLLSGGAASLTYTGGAPFDFGTGGAPALGDFCIEFWVRPASIGTAQYLVSYSNPTVPAGTDYAFGIYLSTAGKIATFVKNSAGTDFGAIIGSTTLVVSTWYHIAFVRNSGVCSLYVNGLAEGGTANALIAIATPASRIFQIGVVGGTSFATCSIDGVRVTKGNPRYTSNFSLALPTALFEAESPATATSILTAPMGVLQSTSGSGSNITGPMGSLVARTGANSNLSSPKPILRAVFGSTAGENAFTGSAPMGQLQSLSGATARMQSPSGVLVATVTVPISVRAELTGPAGSLVSSSTVGVLVQADLRLSSAGTLVATTGARAQMQGRMGALQAIATVGVLARFAGSVPMGELNAMMTAGVVVRAELLSPMLRPTDRMTALLVAPMGSLTAVARAVVAVVYEAYAVNLKPGSKMPNQVTRYTNYPFNQIVRFQNKYIGVADDGLYLLGGATDYDDTTPAGPAWAWHTAITDFNSPQKKNVREAVFSGRLGPKATASVSVREAADTTYAATIVRGTAAQNHRIKYGRGLSARYWSFGLADADGGECDVDRVEFDAAELGRKL